MKKTLKQLVVLMMIAAFSMTLFTGFAPKKVSTNKRVKKPAANVTSSASVKGSSEVQVTTCQAVQVETGSKGLLWKVKYKGATVYIMGSIGVTKQDMFPFRKTVEDAFSNSNNLVVDSNTNDSSVTERIKSKYLYSENDNLYNHVSPACKELVSTMLKQDGMQESTAITLKPWVLDSAFVNFKSDALGYNAGVENYFLKKAKDNKKIVEFEGEEKEVDLMNSFSDTVMDKILIHDINSLKDQEADLSNIYNAYKTGDYKSLKEAFINDIKDSPKEFNDALYTNRNKSIADSIDGYLKTNDSYFVVVNISHLVADNSVIDLLKQKGYKVEDVK